MRRSFVLLAFVAGCGHGLGQTAKTQPVGKTRLTLGVVRITNANDEVRNGPDLQNLAPEVSVRVGTSEHTDIGITNWFGVGLRTDVKWNLFDRDRPYALAPRAGVGAAKDFYGVALFGAFAGLIASYELPGKITPYGAATFANHWILRNDKPSSEVLAPGETFAARKGYGDGLLQLVVGLQLKLGAGSALVGEYQRWIPMQNDPGDFYKFVPNDVLMIATNICLSMECDWR